MVVNTLVVKKIFQNVSITVNSDPLTLITHREKLSNVESAIGKLVGQSLREQLSTDTSNTHQGIGTGRVRTIEEVVEFVSVVDGDHFHSLFSYIDIIQKIP